jgi:hypothetical protein
MRGAEAMKIDITKAVVAIAELEDELAGARAQELGGSTDIDYAGVKKAWQRLNAQLWPLVDMGREHIVTGHSTLRRHA